MLIVTNNNSELAQSSWISWIFPVGGASWSLDLCEAILNHATSLRGLRRGDNIFKFLYKFLGIIGRKRLGQNFWIMISVYYYLLKGIRLELGLDNTFWIWKYLTFLQTRFTFRFSHTKKHSLTSKNRTC